MMSIHNGLSGQENLEQSYAFINLAGQVATQVCRVFYFFYPCFILVLRLGFVCSKAL